MNISIIGGGLSGVFAARTLFELGHNPTIIEKSRSTGGRMATRRIGNGLADHGAQFFTVRSPQLQTLTNEWLEQKLIKRWFGDDFPRYSGTDGMNSFVKNLAKGLNIKLEEQVLQVKSSELGITITTQNGNAYFSDAVVITAPVPQALQLLQESPLILSNQLKETLSASSFKPCFVALLILIKPLSIEKDGIVSEGLPPGIDKIIANDQKGISACPILSVYMTGDWSAKYFEQQDETVLEQIFAALTHDVIDTSLIVGQQLKRWRYAEATHVYKKPFMQLDDLPIFLAGDSFLTEQDTSGRTRVESAILSGIHVGEAIHREFLK